MTLWLLWLVLASVVLLLLLLLLLLLRIIVSLLGIRLLLHVGSLALCWILTVELWIGRLRLPRRDIRHGVVRH